jgi:alkylhydroperoxidase/carboxymuconolactone decarboxylase family protein YurZ
MDYTERLQHLARNATDIEDLEALSESALLALDPKTLALVRIATLIAVNAEVPSFGEQTDAAISSGATAAEIVDVLVAVLPVVGLPRVVAAAPRVALALGYDTDVIT